MINKIKSLKHNMFKNANVLKSIGHGVYGIVKLIKYKNVKYALKKEHIFKKDIKISMYSSVWRDILFSVCVGNIYPDYFITLYEYNIINNCNFKQPINKHIKLRPLQKKLFKSKYCIHKIYSLVDTTLDKIDISTKVQFYNIVIQLCNIMNILYINNFIHGDIHVGNIGIINSSNNNIKIKLIDFGKTQSGKYLLKKEKKEYNFMRKNELTISILNLFINDFFDNENVKPYEEYKHIFKKSKYNKLFNKYTTNIDLKIQIFERFYPKQFQKMVSIKLPKKVYNIKSPLTSTEMKKLITLCFKTSRRNYKNIIQYCNKQINMLK